MNTAIVEDSCTDCLLRALNTLRVQEREANTLDVDPDMALERQLEQIERSFGPEWKW
jgi:hypothetical protein